MEKRPQRELKEEFRGAKGTVKWMVEYIAGRWIDLTMGSRDWRKMTESLPTDKWAFLLWGVIFVGGFLTARFLVSSQVWFIQFISIFAWIIAGIILTVKLFPQRVKEDKEFKNWWLDQIRNDTWDLEGEEYTPKKQESKPEDKLKE